MDWLEKILCEATAAIGEGYFQLPILGAEDPVYRERVYCYELYHQMRRLWPEGCQYRLNGEVDKAAHPHFQELTRGKPKPDLIVHKPGASENHAVIEVKSVEGRRGIQKDLETLSLFTSKLKYEKAIFLIFGEDGRAAVMVLNKVQECARKVVGLDSIEVWRHRKPGAPVELAETLRPPR
jgi:hypothetical protein